MTPATLTNTAPDRHEFGVALKNIGKIRPRVDVDSWTEHDAAAYWFQDYDPSQHNCLPAQLILGVVHRLFVEHYRRIPPLLEFFDALWTCNIETELLAPVSGSGQARASMSMNQLCSVMHYASHPECDHDGNVGISWLEGFRLGYCGRKTCTKKASYLGGCLPVHIYDKLETSGYLVPWTSVEWGGIGVWLTPIRHALDAPYISVRKDRSHVAKTLVPYYIANTARTLHRIVPALMYSGDFRKTVSDKLRLHIEALRTERLRFHGMVSMGYDTAKAMWLWDYEFTLSAWGLSAEVAYGTDWLSQIGIDHFRQADLDSTLSPDIFPTVSEPKKDD